MNNNPSNQKEIICSCSGTTKAQIKELINNGIDTVAKISHETGANTGCGSCDVLIMELLAQQSAKPGVQ